MHSAHFKIGIKKLDWKNTIAILSWLETNTKFGLFWISQFDYMPSTEEMDQTPNLLMRPTSKSTDETNLVLFPLTIWLQSFTREMQILSSYFRLKNHLAWRSYNRLVLNFISFTLKHFLKAWCLENWFHLEDLYLVYNIATAFLI